MVKGVVDDDLSVGLYGSRWSGQIGDRGMHDVIIDDGQSARLMVDNGYFSWSMVVIRGVSGGQIGDHICE